MQDYFYELSDFVTSRLTGNEVFTASFSGEDSDFVRFNHSKVRQAGNVVQRYIAIDLIDGNRHVTGTTTLTGEKDEDHARLKELVGDLRAKLPNLPEDPHLLYSTEVASTEQFGEDQLPEQRQAVTDIVAAGEGRDLVGLYAAGGILQGFANSLGQRNWFSSYSFNLDWSFYYEKDKAVKTSYAGFAWDPDGFRGKAEGAAEQLTVLRKEPRSIDPGRYRVYMSPVAVYDFVGMLGWGGFGLKSHKTKQTVLLRMVEGDAKLNPAMTISENTAEGVAPNFQAKGYIKPDKVTLIDHGAFQSCLVSPRSAKEYDVPTNGAGAWEAPESLDISAGDVPQARVLDELDTGVYINNVHYLNYSDRPGCRITGLTRFATFWVENGKVVAPLNVMRFDETLYRAFGENLLGLTKDREVILDAGSYGGRATSSGIVPGALVDDFNFNL